MDITVGIVGCNGRFGRWLTQYCKSRGYAVVGCDKDSEIGVYEIMHTADVIIFAVPIHETTKVIESATPLSQGGQLFMDVTSVKVAPVEKMLESCGEVVGLHPLFAPPQELSCEGRTIVVCEGRLDKWRSWVEDFLSGTKAHIRHLDPVVHDRLMLAEQNLVHLNLLIMASVIREMGIPATHLMCCATPTSRMLFAGMGRVLSQDPDLLMGIQRHNPEAREMMSQYGHILQRFSSLVSSDNKDAFSAEIAASRLHLDGKFFKDTARVFEECFPKE